MWKDLVTRWNNISTVCRQISKRLIGKTVIISNNYWHGSSALNSKFWTWKFNHKLYSFNYIRTSTEACRPRTFINLIVANKGMKRYYIMWLSLPVPLLKPTRSRDRRAQMLVKSLIQLSNGFSNNHATQYVIIVITIWKRRADEQQHLVLFVVTVFLINSETLLDNYSHQRHQQIIILYINLTFRCLHSVRCAGSWFGLQEEPEWDTIYLLLGKLLFGVKLARKWQYVRELNSLFSF